MVNTVACFENKIYLHHMLLRGSNEEIGYQLGCYAKKKHQIDKSNHTDHEIIKNQYNYLRANYPQHYERMLGFANAYGESLENHDYDFSYFGRLIDNSSCSAVFYPPEITENGLGYISRNLDFSLPSDFKERSSFFPFKHSYLIEMYPENGYPSISLFCFEVFGLALEGINSEGLAVIHLADADTRMDHDDLSTMQTRPGFNEFLPVQYLLDNCATVQEAKTALGKIEHYHVAIPVHLLIADKKGDSFVFEYSYDGTKKVFIDGIRKSPFKITNFQLNRLTDQNLIRKMEFNSTENGYDRYKILENRISSIQLPFTENLIENINTDVYIHKDNEEELERTLFHSIYDLSSSSVKLSLLPTINMSKNNFVKFTLTT